MESPWLFVGAIILGSLSFVTSLAWNDGIQAVFNEYYPDSKFHARGKIIYAAFITVVLVSVAYFASKYYPRIANKAL